MNIRIERSKNEKKKTPFSEATPAPVQERTVPKASMIDVGKLLDLISAIRGAFDSLREELAKVKDEKKRKEFQDAIESRDLDRIRALLFDPDL